MVESEGQTETQTEKSVVERLEELSLGDRIEVVYRNTTPEGEFERIDSQLGYFGKVLHSRIMNFFSRRIRKSKAPDGTFAECSLKDYGTLCGYMSVDLDKIISIERLEEFREGE